MKLERRDGGGEGQTPEIKPERPTGSGRKREISVIIYTTVLFAVALALILLSYAMQRNTNTAISSMSAQHGEFSAQAMKNIEELQNENQELRLKRDALEALVELLDAEPGEERDKALRQMEKLAEYLDGDSLEIYNSILEENK